VLDDPVVRQQLAAAHSRMRVINYLGYRARTAMSQGRPPGPETSVLKLAFSQHFTELASLAKAIQGAAGMLDDDGTDGSSVLTWRFLFSPSTGIAGGTSEVQRSIIGERVLGLPREERPTESTAPPGNREPVAASR
jgi:alkylation response protein AidB-like acyl-CoA dehydrogenase